MKLTNCLLTALTIGLTSLSANALEKVEPVNSIHTNKAFLINSIEEALKTNVETISTKKTKRVILIAKKSNAKSRLTLSKAKAKTDAFSIAE